MRPVTTTSMPVCGLMARPRTLVFQITPEIEARSSLMSR